MDEADWDEHPGAVKAGRCSGIMLDIREYVQSGKSVDDGEEM